MLTRLLLFSQKCLLLFFSLTPLLLSTPPVVHAQWEPDVRLTYDDSISLTSYSNAWSVVASGETVHVVWFDARPGGYSNYDLYYKRSTDAGLSWSSDLRLTFANRYSRFPCIAVSGPNIHVVWEDGRDGYYRVFYLRSTDGGESWGPETRLANDTTSFSPSIAVSGPNLHVVWSDRMDLRQRNQEVYYKRSTNNGTSWSQDTRLTFDDSISSYPCVTVSDSIVHVVWQDNRSSKQRIFYKRSNDGGLSWGPDTSLGDTIRYSWVPCAAVSGMNVFVAWHETRNYWPFDQGQIVCQRSTDRGLTWWGRTGVSHDSTSWRVSLAASGTNVHAVWDDTRQGGSNYEIFYNCSTNGGASWPPESRLTFNPAWSAHATLAVSGSKIHVVWWDSRDGNYEVYYKRNPTGNVGVEDVHSLRLTPSTFSLTVFPNPFVSFASVPGHSSERFALYDISGRKVGVYKGERIGWDVSPGIYFLRPNSRSPQPDNRILRIVKLR